MTPAEYRAIADEVSKRGPSVKLLVFGIGHGSAAISRMNPTGTTVFAEDRVDWVNWATLLGWTVIKPSYWTSTAIHARQANLTASPSLIIPELRSVKVGRADPITLWDVIVIDGPDVGKQGRFQPLATAADRISANGVVFVHDCSDTVVRQ